MLANSILSVVVTLGIGLSVTSCSPKLGRHSFAHPPKGDGYFWLFGASEAHVLKLGEYDKNLVEKDGFFHKWVSLNPTKTYLDLSIEYYGLKVGSDCCQTAAILINGVPTGRTEEVEIRRYQNNNFLINGRLYPLNFFKLNTERFLSPYLIGSVGYYKYFFQNNILTNTGSFYDSKEILSKGFFQGIGTGLYYMSENTRGFVSYFIEYRYEFNKNKNVENLNGGLFTIGIRFL